MFFYIKYEKWLKGYNCTLEHAYTATKTSFSSSNPKAKMTLSSVLIHQG